MSTPSRQQKLEREIFTTSRELEYFTESELTTQTGYDRGVWWPHVIVKEALDNAIDECELAGVAPEITLAFSEREISITDNGRGIPPEVVAKICDYSTRTSDKRAYVSPKGMGTTSVRQLFEQLSLQFSDLKILVMHDFDKSGFSIAGTLKRSTERFQFEHPPEIINLGLRLEDVERYGLESEPVDYTSDPGPNLEKNGATAAEIQFLRGEPYTYWDKGKPKQGFHGQRVELNAFTNSQLLEWLEAKLVEHGVEKVIPDDATLAQDYRRKVGLREYRRLIEEVKPKAEEKARNAKVPKNLRQQIKRRLKENPALAWDDEDVLMPEEE
jgi:hypothetical protein